MWDAWLRELAPLPYRFPGIGMSGRLITWLIMEMMEGQVCVVDIFAESAEPRAAGALSNGRWSESRNGVFCVRLRSIERLNVRDVYNSYDEGFGIVI